MPALSRCTQLAVDVDQQIAVLFVELLEHSLVYGTYTTLYDLF